MGDMGRSCSTPKTSWKMQGKVQLKDQNRQQHFGDLRMDGSPLLLRNLLPSTRSIVLTLTLIYNFLFHIRIIHLDIIKVIYSPMNVQVNCLKSIIKIYIKTAPTCFGAVTPSSGSSLPVPAKVTLCKNSQLWYIGV
jgi:hypothetical protein